MKRIRKIINASCEGVFQFMQDFRTLLRRATKIKSCTIMASSALIFPSVSVFIGDSLSENKELNCAED